MLDPALSRLAVAGVIALITTLAFATQLIVLHVSIDATIFFNILIALTYFTYYQAITTLPGRVPKSWTPTTPFSALESGETAALASSTSTIISSPPRFCSTCDAFKPPRAHHCRVCNACIPKMDHHCPWTANCVGYSNHPQFLRFLIYTNIALGFLNFLLLGEWLSVYDAWNQPAYLFPFGFWEMFTLVALSLLSMLTGITLFVLLCRSLMNAAMGITTIETWEVERHETRVRRNGGRQRAFPFDFGIYENLKVAFGYRSFMLWMWPWAKAKPIGSREKCFEGEGEVDVGCTWEGNGVDEGGWPPEDETDDEEGKEMPQMGSPWVVEDVGDVEGFKRRQREDMQRRKRMVKKSADEEEIGKGWKNSEGEGLADFGVDEDVEDEDIPLGVLMRRRRVIGGQ